MRAFTPPSLLLFSVLPLFATACTAPETSDTSSDSALIGGRDAKADEFPATLLIQQSCTAAKVGPRHILTAAHCVTGAAAASYLPGSYIAITSSLATGRFATNGEPSFRAVAIERVEVQPDWEQQCRERRDCGSVDVAGRSPMADAAVIITRETLDGIAEARVDLSPVADGDRVAITGFGCEGAVGGYWDYGNQRLRVAITRAVRFDEAIHPGSFVHEEDRARGVVDTMAGIYVVTPGPNASGALAEPAATDADGGPVDPSGTDGGAAEATLAGGLCPGDSGGPLYRVGDGGLTVIGINANYTFSGGARYYDAEGRPFDYGGSPVTNWHTRVDGVSGLKVGRWLASLGVATTCTRGGCDGPDETGEGDAPPPAR